jgi:tol-pal system protein YbgF
MRAAVSHGMIRCALAALLASVAIGAQAGVFDDDEARKAILDLRAKVDNTQKDLSARIDKLEAAQQGQLDLSNQIEGVRQDLARLRGQIELLTNAVATQEKRQRDFYTDLDARLRKLEPQQVTVDGKTAAVDQVESRTYDGALNQFKANDFKGAIASFDQFLRQYPESVYAPSAQYWMGTSYYAQRDYKNAIATQQQLIKAYPDSARVADAMLNIGSSQIDMGDKKAARKTLDSLIATYPDSPAAGVAKDRLASLH